MATNSSISVTEGTGKNIASFSISETTTKELQRVVNSDSAGVEAVTPGTAATHLGKAEDAAHTSGDVGVMALAIRNDSNAVFSGTDLDYTPISVDSSGNLRFVGNISSGTTDAGKPVKIGGVAHTASPTAVTDGQRVDFVGDKVGKQVVVGSIRDLKVQQQTTITASTSETTVLTAVASNFLDVYGVIVANSSTTIVNVTFKDSTSGTTRFNIVVPGGETRGFMLPESGAHSQAATNTNWTATCGTSVTSILITMLAVKNI